jgi:urease accessory protein
MAAAPMPHILMATITTTDSMLPQLRLMHLVSPSLPTGGFTYSQGLEWAVECGWVHDENTLQEWLGSLLENSLTWLELPLLARLYRADQAGDGDAFRCWSQQLVASRETRELRLEEHNRGRALTALLPDLGVPVPGSLVSELNECQLAGFAIAANYWQIPLQETLGGYLWAWLENMTLAGVKIIPLGQSAGQRVLTSLTPAIPSCIDTGLSVQDDEIGASCPAQSIASCMHETQYTRIYRS